MKLNELNQLHTYLGLKQFAVKLESIIELVSLEAACINDKSELTQAYQQLIHQGNDLQHDIGVALGLLEQEVTR